MQDILLFPANGNAIEALDCCGRGFRPLGFIDDDGKKVGSTLLGLPVFDRAALASYPAAKVLAVPGSPTSFPQRPELIASLQIPRDRFATVIHPAAVVSPYAHVGVNVLIMAGTVITATAVIDDHVLILPNSVVHHDSHVATYTILGSGVLIAGDVNIGERCYIGSGSRLRNNLTVAATTLIGMASTVVQPIDEPGGIWVGSPARFVRSLTDGGKDSISMKSAAPVVVPSSVRGTLENPQLK
jgi:sugar O-acyltransferase (sialic acid O-acetyltransferase NeuD family)